MSMPLRWMAAAAPTQFDATEPGRTVSRLLGAWCAAAVYRAAAPWLPAGTLAAARCSASEGQQPQVAVGGHCDPARIGVTIGATLLFTRGGGGTSATPSTSASADDIASADDTGPVSIITDEPTCKTFNGINNSLAATQAKGWGDQRERSAPQPSGPPISGLKFMRSQRLCATPPIIETLARQTPHRVVRELYEQFIAFGRAYAGASQPTSHQTMRSRQPMSAQPRR